jgi:enoyl-CoA hydratase/carnithine racemase
VRAIVIEAERASVLGRPRPERDARASPFFQRVFDLDGADRDDHLLPQPVIAKVHATATAAGCLLVAVSDLAVARARHAADRRPIDAATALDSGLVKRVVPAEALDEEVAESTPRSRARARSGPAFGKEAFYAQIRARRAPRPRTHDGDGDERAPTTSRRTCARSWLNARRTARG